MYRKKLNMDEIHDIHGLRLIVENEEDCYKAMEVVHKLWSEVPGKFKDYITHPKFNGYDTSKPWFSLSFSYSFLLLNAVFANEQVSISAHGGYG